MSSLPPNVRKRGKFYYFRTRLNGSHKEIPLGSDLAMARQLARQHAGKVAAIKSGLAHVDEAKWQEAERQPITVHVEDWYRTLVNRGRRDHYTRQSRDRVLLVLDLAGIERISQLEIHAIEAALVDLKHTCKGRGGNKELSDRSVNHAARAVKSFSRWLRKAKRAQDDKLQDLTLPEVLTKRTRKALLPEEIAALIETTRTRPRRAKIDGPDRSVLYAVAAGTGLRLGELESLTRESFRMDSDPPVVVCESAYTKNSKQATQPITAELASLLRPWLAGKSPGSPVFLLDRIQIAPALRKDLEAAGVAESESYDFHCLRHSYITAVVKSGASLKVCQELARHSDPKLTLSVYSHLTVHDLTQGLEILSHTIPTPAVLTGLTGTEGGMMISSPGRPEMAPHGLAEANTNLYADGPRHRDVH
jgi:site-specific recombinase XerD